MYCEIPFIITIIIIIIIITTTTTTIPVKVACYSLIFLLISSLGV
jgi:hypothetical protein